MAHCSFFFGPTEVSALRRFLPPNLRDKCSKFEVLTACLWRCRTIALQEDPEEKVRIICVVNARSKFNPRLPSGYYRNCFAFPMAMPTSGKLCQNSLGYALKLVRKAKNEVNEEYMGSLADLMVIKGRPFFTAVRSYLISDVSRAGFREVDFGWGEAEYEGPAKGSIADSPDVLSFYLTVTNEKGKIGTVVPICLPTPAMKGFVNDLNSMLNKEISGRKLKQHLPMSPHKTTTFIKSSL